MLTMKEARKLRIAISGGGLAGAAIANALFGQPHLDVSLYESAAQFSERGLAVSFAIHAKRALERLVPDAEGLLNRAGAVQMNSTRIVLGSGPTAGTKVLDLGQDNPTFIVHRAALLRELLAPIPREKMFASKKLKKIDTESPDGSLTLHFEDGSDSSVDAIIGTDGIFGFVRSQVLGSDHPTTKAVPGGWYMTSNLIPYAKARDTLGNEYFEVDRQYGWIGDSGFIMHDILNDRQIVQCIATWVDRDVTAAKHMKEVSNEELKSAFAAWMEGPIAKNAIKLLLDQPSPSTFSMWEHRDAPIYFNKRVCIAGDAAHAMTPWQGSGAACALEDAVVLGALFGKIKRADEIERVFRAYDTVRRPRTQAIAASSRETGRIMTGMVESVGVDAEKMRDALKDKWKFIFNFDLDKQVAEAVVLLKE